MYDLETHALRMIKANPNVVSVKENEFLLYPNPTDGIVFIRYNYDFESELIIRDITGRIIKKMLLPQGVNNIRVDLDNVAKGIYSYEQLIKGETINQGKITIR